MVPATIAIPHRVFENIHHWGPEGLGPCAVACRPPRSVAHRAPHCVRAREVLRAARQHRMMAGSVQCPRFHRHTYSAGCTSLGAWLLADACTRTSSDGAKMSECAPAPFLHAARVPMGCTQCTPMAELPCISSVVNTTMNGCHSWRYPCVGLASACVAHIVLGEGGNGMSRACALFGARRTRGARDTRSARRGCPNQSIHTGHAPAAPRGARAPGEVRKSRIVRTVCCMCRFRAMAPQGHAERALPVFVSPLRFFGAYQCPSRPRMLNR